MSDGNNTLFFVAKYNRWQKAKMNFQGLFQKFRIKNVCTTREQFMTFERLHSALLKIVIHLIGSYYISLCDGR
jgi:hypothetical protein